VYTTSAVGAIGLPPKKREKQIFQCMSDLPKTPPSGEGVWYCPFCKMSIFGSKKTKAQAQKHPSYLMLTNGHIDGKPFYFTSAHLNCIVWDFELYVLSLTLIIYQDMVFALVKHARDKDKKVNRAALFVTFWLALMNGFQGHEFCQGCSY